MLRLKEILEVVKLYRKTIQMMLATLSLIIVAFCDAWLTDFKPNDLAYYTLAGLAGFLVQQSVKEKLNGGN